MTLLNLYRQTGEPYHVYGFAITNNYFYGAILKIGNKTGNTKNSYYEITGINW